MSPEISFRRSALAVRYSTVLFPFDVRDLLTRLPDLGYVLIDELQGAVAAGLTISSVEGVVARRMNTSVQVDTSRLTVTVATPDLSACLQELTRIESILKDELGTDSRQLARFYELITEAVVATDNSPLDAWHHQLADVPLVTKLSEVIGVDLSAYGLRLVPSHSVPNQDDWLDLRIEPRVSTPHRAYHIHVIFRNTSRDEVERFASGLANMVQQTIALVEEQ